MIGSYPPPTYLIQHRQWERHALLTSDNKWWYLYTTAVKYHTVLLNLQRCTSNACTRYVPVCMYYLYRYVRTYPFPVLYNQFALTNTFGTFWSCVFKKNRVCIFCNIIHSLQWKLKVHPRVQFHLLNNITVWVGKNEVQCERSDRHRMWMEQLVSEC